METPALSLPPCSLAGERKGQLQLLRALPSPGLSSPSSTWMGCSWMAPLKSSANSPARGEQSPCPGVREGAELSAIRTGGGVPKKGAGSDGSDPYPRTSDSPYAPQRKPKSSCCILLLSPELRPGGFWAVSLVPAVTSSVCSRAEAVGLAPGGGAACRMRVHAEVTLTCCLFPPSFF